MSREENRTSHNIYTVCNGFVIQDMTSDRGRNVKRSTAPVGVFETHVGLGELLGIGQLLHILNVRQRFSHGSLNTHRRFTLM